MILQIFQKNFRQRADILCRTKIITNLSEKVKQKTAEFMALRLKFSGKTVIIRAITYWETNYAEQTIFS